MFSFGQIILSAVLGTAVSAVALILYQRLGRSDDPGASVSAWRLAAVVGLSILVWRAAGNTPALNDDPIAFISPNDVLCPVVTYACLGLYAGFAGMSGGASWPRVRALLTLVSLIVNVVTI